MNPGPEETHFDPAGGTCRLIVEAQGDRKALECESSALISLGMTNLLHTNRKVGLMILKMNLMQLLSLECSFKDSNLLFYALSEKKEIVFNQ